MRCNDMLPALSKIGVSPFQVWECSASNCDKKFAVIDGVAFPARGPGEEQVRLFFFCCWSCYLSAMPKEALWRA